MPLSSAVDYEEREIKINEFLDCNLLQIIPSSQSQELDRRLASFDQDRTNAVSWDKLKADLTLRAS